MGCGRTAESVYGNWCWEPEALAFISGHYETGEPLPKELLDKMLAAKNYQAALFILRQLEFGLFDFRLHAEFRPDQGAKILETLAEIKKLVAVVPSPSWGRFPHAFSHISPVVMPQVTTATCGLTYWRQMLSRALRKRAFSTVNRAVVPRQHSEPWRFRRADGSVQTLPWS